jgi:hypothetical protein
MIITRHFAYKMFVNTHKISLFKFLRNNFTMDNKMSNDDFKDHIINNTFSTIILYILFLLHLLF